MLAPIATEEKKGAYVPILAVDAKLPIGDIVDFARAQEGSKSRELIIISDDDMFHEIAAQPSFPVIPKDQFCKEAASGKKPRGLLVCLVHKPEYPGFAAVGHIDCDTGEVFHQTKYDLHHQINNIPLLPIAQTGPAPA